MRRAGRAACLAGAAFATASLASVGAMSVAAKPHSAAVRSAPSWTLPDIAGHPHDLQELRGRPHTLFFFCGCGPCHACARLWAQAQHGGELGAAGTPTPTVVIFLGDAPGAKAFVAETGLDPAQTLVLTDPADRVSQRYGVVQCPRVFVLDAGMHPAYTNPDAGRSAQPLLSASALVSRTLTAWRRLTPPRPGTTP